MNKELYKSFSKSCNTRYANQPNFALHTRNHQLVLYGFEIQIIWHFIYR